MNICLLITWGTLDQTASFTLFVVDPKSTHRIMNCWKNFHWGNARVYALKFFIDFKDPTKFSVESFPRNMREVEIDAKAIFFNRQTVSCTNIKNFPSSDVPRNKVSVLWISLFKKVVSLIYWDILWIPGVLRFPGDPDPSAFSASAFTHQSQFISARNCSRVDLDKLCVCILHPGLVGTTDGTSCTNHRHRRSTVQKPTATRGQNNRIGWECLKFHCHHILANSTDTSAITIHNRLKKVPELPLLHPAFTFPTTHLFIQRVKELLTCCSPSKRGSFVQRATKTTLVTISFRCSVERNTEPIHQVDNAWSPFSHFFYGRLVL